MLIVTFELVCLDKTLERMRESKETSFPLRLRFKRAFLIQCLANGEGQAFGFETEAFSTPFVWKEGRIRRVIEDREPGMSVIDRPYVVLCAFSRDSSCSKSGLRENCSAKPFRNSLNRFK